VASEHRVTAATTVPAPLERVWSIVSDLHRYADWVESTIEVLRADDEIGPGARYEERTRLSGLWTATTQWTVTEFAPMERIAFVAEGPRVVRSLALEMTLERHEEGTEVATTYSYRMRYGPLGALLELVVRGNVVNDQRRSLRTLSYLAERADDDPAT
jgi:uncharacterized protein YndB with AHSA1/START domain